MSRKNGRDEAEGNDTVVKKCVCACMCVIKNESQRVRECVAVRKERKKRMSQ